MYRLAALLVWFTATAARSACPGEDLIAAMPEQERRALVGEAASHPNSEGILWRATRDGRSIHLVGTMHLYDPRHARTMARLAPVLASAEHVFLELGAGDQALLQRMIAEDPDLAFLTDGPTLPDLLGEADWDRLRAAMTERGIPGFLAAKMKPWMAMANLGLSRCDMENMRKGLLGLDAMIIDAAIAAGTQPEALEPIDTAFRIFAEIPQAEQIELLRTALAQQGQDSADHAVTLTEAYFREQIQLIWEFGLHQARKAPGVSQEEVDAQTARLENLLVTRRNTAWMDPILDAEGETLVAVGAMHLPGETGLLRLLEDLGFTLERLALDP